MSNRLKSHKHNDRVLHAVIIWITAAAFAGAATADPTGDSPKLSDDPPGGIFLGGGGGGAGGARAALNSNKQAISSNQASAGLDEFNTCKLTHTSPSSVDRVPIATWWWYTDSPANQMVKACVRVGLRSKSSVVGPYTVKIQSTSGSSVSLSTSAVTFGGALSMSPAWAKSDWKLGRYSSPICTSAPINKSAVTGLKQLELVLPPQWGASGSCEIRFGANPRIPSPTAGNVGLDNVPKQPD